LNFLSFFFFRPLYFLSLLFFKPFLQWLKE
jgi:hypothetical protein